MSVKILIISGGPLNEAFGRSFYSSRAWDFVLVCDAGLAFTKEAGIVPDEIVGDYDSVSEEILSYYREQMPERMKTWPSKKDETDTELALLEAFSWLKAVQGTKATHNTTEAEIHIIGGLGGRTDHLLGNLALLLEAEKEGAACFFEDEINRIRLLSPGEIVLKQDSIYGDYFSLIPYLGEVTGLTISGAAYDVEDFVLRPEKSRGVSNRFEKSEVRIRFGSGKLLLIEVRE